MLRSDPIRVAYVVKRYPRYSETFIVNEILAHEEAGWDLDVFSLYPPNDTCFQDAIARVRAPVHYLTCKGIKAAELWAAMAVVAKVLPDLWHRLPEVLDEDINDVYQAMLLARQVQLKHISHIHAHFGSRATAVTRLAAHFAGVSYSFTAHARDIFHESVKQEDLHRKLADANSVVTVSEFNLGYLRDRFGQAAGHVQRIYNGLSLDRFPYRSPQERQPRIVSVGRLVEKKGLPDLVEACAILRDRGVAFGCQIIGTGYLESDLRDQIQTLNLQDRVELIGPRPQSQIIEHLHEASVFAAPCVVGSDGNRDGLPTVLLESMALGTPCVSTDVTGIPEVIRDGQTGLMVRQHDATALANAIQRLLTDPALRMNLATQARKLIETEFDIRRNAANLRSVFCQASLGDPVPTREVVA